MSDDVEPVAEDEQPDDEDRSLIDRMRGTGVGVEDPNIVGDVGPTDIPPGADPETAGDRGPLHGLVVEGDPED